MPTIRLIPSSYGRSNTTYVSVSDSTNMYNNTDNDTYATLTNTRTATTTYYVYIRGFNFSSVPADAVVSSVTIKIKGRQTGLNTSTNYAPTLANSQTAWSGTTASEQFGSTTKTITVPTGTYSWSDIKGYGKNFGIRVSVRRTSSNTQGYLYIYGAEILVNYTLPGSMPVRVKSNGSWVQAQKVLVKDGGTWKEASGIKAKSGGSWH